MCMGTTETQMELQLKHNAASKFKQLNKMNV